MTEPEVKPSQTQFVHDPPMATADTLDAAMAWQDKLGKVRNLVRDSRMGRTSQLNRSPANPR